MPEDPEYEVDQQIKQNCFCWPLVCITSDVYFRINLYLLLLFNVVSVGLLLVCIYIAMSLFFGSDSLEVDAQFGDIDTRITLILAIFNLMYVIALIVGFIGVFKELIVFPAGLCVFTAVGLLLHSVFPKFGAEFGWMITFDLILFFMYLQLTLLIRYRLIQRYKVAVNPSFSENTKLLSDRIK